MTLLVYDKRFLDHQMSDHPECAERLVSIISHLRKTDLWPQLIQISPREATEEELAWAHTPSHIRDMKEFCEKGGGWLDGDTYALPSPYLVAKLAAGAVLSSIEEIAAGKAKTAFCAVRPPGHHAAIDQAMGFCLFN